LCEENAMISEIFSFININMQKLLLMKGSFINIDLLQQFEFMFIKEKISEIMAFSSHK
jgi:hypothetical protein